MRTEASEAQSPAQGHLLFTGEGQGGGHSGGLEDRGMGQEGTHPVRPCGHCGDGWRGGLLPPVFQKCSSGCCVEIACGGEACGGLDKVLAVKYQDLVRFCTCI